MKKKFLGAPIILAIVYDSVDLRGKASAEVIEELLHENNTVGEGLVSFEDDIKAECIFTEASAEAEMQDYTSGAPGSAGSMGGFDTVVTPKKVMYYQEFDPNSIRFSRFKTTMKPGAWNTLSEEFERVVIGGIYAKEISLDLERKFWNNVTPATKAAVAALTAGTNQNEVSTAEKALVAATPSTGTFGRFDGVVQKMIYNASNPAHTGAVGGRVKVVGTTVTASNVKTEIDKLYAAIPSEALEREDERIYAPRSWRQFVHIYNNNPVNPREAFDVSPDRKTISYNGIKMEFVPIPENVAIAARIRHIIWCTDLMADINTMKIDRIANNREDWFVKNIMTIETHVVNQRFNALYVG